MIKNFLPNKILSLKQDTINIFSILLLLILALGLSYALFLSPPDHIQGDSVRIMYVHVPASFLAIGCFCFLGMASICNLIFKIKFMSLLAKSSAPIGCIFSLISIVTGSFWGKPTWGIWWVWDARLTSMAILIFFYIAYILAWKLINDFDRANKISSLIAIIGLLNLPVIKYSVDWWNTLHQPASVLKLDGPAIHSSMLIPLLLMASGYTGFYLWMLIVRVRAEFNSNKIRAIRIRQANR